MSVHISANYSVFYLMTPESIPLSTGLRGVSPTEDYPVFQIHMMLNRLELTRCSISAS